MNSELRDKYKKWINTSRKLEKEFQDENKKIDEAIRNFREFKILNVSFVLVFYGSLIGLVINLLSNIIHDHFKVFGFSYVICVLAGLGACVYLISNYVLSLFDEFVDSNELIKNWMKKDGRDKYSEKLNNLLIESERINTEISSYIKSNSIKNVDEFKSNE